VVPAFLHHTDSNQALQFRVSTSINFDPHPIFAARIGITAINRAVRSRPLGTTTPHRLSLRKKVTFLAH
jgi:hypothetical protein